MAVSNLDITEVIAQTPLFREQWYLQNNGQTGGTIGADANIIDAWSVATGQGVVIGIIDSGVDYTHVDLNDNYNSRLSYDFKYDDSDPAPYFNAHGTKVAGIAVGEGDNNLGIIGAAPDATFASLQVDFADLSEADNALSYNAQEIDIYNNSWGLNSNFVRPSILIENAIKNNIREGRGGKGSIYVFAAGNEAVEEDNVNYDPYANSRYTIAVAAIDHNGKRSSYSNPGASLLISGYSSNDWIKVTTTDNTTFLNSNTYADNFGGTSAAAPLVSGAIALMLEANPDLTWRDVQHILVETAEKNDPSDLDWTVNGAGHDVNHNYGFGGIDATAAVNAAKTWQNVAEEVSLTSETINVSSEIPYRSLFNSGIGSSFAIAQDINVEWVEVVFNANHHKRGDLEIVLTSPDGTESILAESRNDYDDNYDDWIFTSSRNWGESSQGEWKLTVADENFLFDDGVWNSWKINLYGTEKKTFSPESDLDSPLYRFQNNNLPGTYLFAGESERRNINRNFTNFEEEGIAFKVGIEAGDNLIPIYRFQSKVNSGSYLFVGTSERNNINNNFTNSFTEEGIAFYVYGSDSGLGEPVYRFQNLIRSGTYLFATATERNNIIANYSNFIEEGVAFNVDI